MPELSKVSIFILMKVGQLSYCCNQHELIQCIDNPSIYNP